MAGSTVVFHNSLIPVLISPSPVGVAVPNFISYCTEICLCPGLFLSPFTEPFPPSAISRRDQMVRAEHSTDGEHTTDLCCGTTALLVVSCR